MRFLNIDIQYKLNSCIKLQTNYILKHPSKLNPRNIILRFGQGVENNKLDRTIKKRQSKVIHLGKV